MYPQRDEEAVILKVFQGMEPGRFLDIGAYDGKTFSNTLALAERGWSGVCVEPSPTAFVGLLKTHGANPRITLVNAAVNDGHGMVRFWDSGGDAISTTDPDHKAKWIKKANVPYREIYVRAITVPLLLQEFPGPYDFVDIDTEGTSADLFMQMPWRGIRPRAICVEYDDKKNMILQHAAQCGYRLRRKFPENLLLVEDPLGDPPRRARRERVPAFLTGEVGR